MEHKYASPGSLPYFGEKPALEDITSEMSKEEIREVALYASNNGRFNYKELEEAFENYKRSGETGSTIVDSDDLKTSIEMAGLNEIGEIDRFLYSELEINEETIEVQFFARGDYKRVFKSKDSQIAIIEPREQEYNDEDAETLLNAIESNHHLLDNARYVRPPSNREPEIIEHDGSKIMVYGFNEEMIPIKELSEDEIAIIEDNLRKAERELDELLQRDKFRALDPTDFNFFSDGDRAKSHAFVPSRYTDDLENLDKVIVGDLGEIPKSYEKRDKFAV